MKTRTGLPLALFGVVVALAFALVTALAAALTDRRCPAGSYDGYRATGCYRSPVPTLPNGER